MRATGRTTRIVDEAIQKLFKQKEIKIVKDQEEALELQKKGGTQKDVYVFDHYSSFESKIDLWHRIKKRLFREYHLELFDIKKFHIKLNK